MITSQTPLISVPTPGYVIKQFTFSRNPKGNLTGQGIFSVMDINNNEVDTVSFSVSEKDWNVFWTAFNNGTFLYQTLNTQKNLGLTIPDLSQEGDFTNK